MIVIEKNEGRKISYEIFGNKICFDDDLTINLAKREEDDPVHIDICYDEDNALVIGAAAGRMYVAEIDIPARQYIEKKVEAEIGEGESSLEYESVPFDMDKVTLTLWAVE